jgi:FkbM family methyltransferase
MAEMSEVSYYSQFGEDRELERRFQGRTGYFLDIGAADGVSFSNTLRLEQLGWHGLLIEADPDAARDCARARPGSRVVHCAAVGLGAPAEISFEIAVDNPHLSSLRIARDKRRRLRSWKGRVEIREVTVPARTADSVLDEDPPERIDVVSIDVEGQEATVLGGLDLRRWRPEVVIIERNTRLPSRRVFEQLHRAGYRYEQTTGVNDWFVAGPITLGYRARLASQLYAVNLTSRAARKCGRAIRRVRPGGRR